MKRIFIAVDISDAARAAAAAHSRSLRDRFPGLRVGWERPEKMHVTLTFLGDVADESVGKVVDAVRTAAEAFGSLRLSLDATGVFPNVRRPRVLWLGIGGESEGLSTLKSEIDVQLRANGFGVDERWFRPHLTIARPREPEASRALAELHMSAGLVSLEFEVCEVVVYESVLDHRGSRYSALAKVDL